MSRLRVVVVDDERPARLRLRRLLGAHTDIDVAGEAANAAEARALLVTARPDLLFLDVQMPGESGFDLLATLAERPRVVFVTAFDAYAVRAFEEEALDYLLKPFRPERLALTLERARGARAGRSDDVDARLERVLARLEAAREPGGRGAAFLDRVTARTGERVDLVPVRDVLYFHAEDKYVAAHTAGGSHLLTLTLDQLERELDPQRFARVHRSVIVNLDAVASIESGFAGTFSLLLRGPAGLKVPVSRQRARALRERLRF